MNGKLGGGNTTGRLTELDAAGLQVLRVLGWVEAGVRMRFFDNGRPGEAFMTVFAGGRFVMPGVEALRRLGVSFVQGDPVTLLEENGTAVRDEVVLSVTEYDRGRASSE